MPKVRRRSLPPALLDHLAPTSRKCPWKVVQSFRRNDGLGEGELIKTFLMPGQVGWNKASLNSASRIDANRLPAAGQVTFFRLPTMHSSDLATSQRFTNRLQRQEKLKRCVGQRDETKSLVIAFGRLIFRVYKQTNAARRFKYLHELLHR